MTTLDDDELLARLELALASTPAAPSPEDEAALRALVGDVAPATAAARPRRVPRWVVVAAAGAITLGGPVAAAAAMGPDAPGPIGALGRLLDRDGEDRAPEPTTDVTRDTDPSAPTADDEVGVEPPAPTAAGGGAETAPAAGATPLPTGSGTGSEDETDDDSSPSGVHSDQDEADDDHVQGDDSGSDDSGSHSGSGSADSGPGDSDDPPGSDDGEPSSNGDGSDSDPDDPDSSD